MSTIRKYGRASTSASAPIPPGVFSSLLYPADPIRWSYDENATPLAERGEITTFASSGKSAEDGSLKRRKVTKVKASAMEKNVAKGHIDDIEFLKCQTDDEATHNLKNLGFYKLSFLLPREWKLERLDRCRLWLINSLGFKEFTYGQDIAYAHTVNRTEEFNAAAKAVIARQRGPEPGGDATPRAAPALAPLQRPSSLSLTDLHISASAGDETSRPGSNKRSLTVATKRFAPRERSSDSDSDEEDDESPRPSTFSPKSTGRSSRTAHSPFFGTRGRALTSPAEVNLVNFMQANLHLSEEAAGPPAVSMDEPPKTRSRQNSVRSRHNSECSTVDGFTVALRCPSRAEATIHEDANEDEEAEEEEELAQYHASSTATMLSLSSAEGSAACSTSMIYPQLSTAVSPVMPQKSSFSEPSQPSQWGNAGGYGHGDDGGVDSDAATVHDEELQSDLDEPDTHRLRGGPAAHMHATLGDVGSAAGAGHRSATSSPVHTIPAAASDVHLDRPTFAHPPRPPSELRDAPGRPMALKAEDQSPASLRRSVPEASRPTVFGRGPMVPDRPKRQGRTSRPANRSLGAQGKSVTMPIMSTHIEASPGATLAPAAGLGGGVGGGFLQPTFHTPVAIKPPSGVVEDYRWEESERTSAYVLEIMQAEFRVAVERHQQEQAAKPKLVRALSDPFSGTHVGHASPPCHRDSDFLRLGSHAGFGISFGRDSMGSHGSIMKALVCDRPSLGPGDDEMNVCHGGSPCDLAQQAVRERIQQGGGSLLGRGTSPYAAFTAYSPKHSPGSQTAFAATGVHSYRAAVFNSGLDSNSPPFHEGATQARQLKKKRHSQARLRRMSMSAARPPHGSHKDAAAPLAAIAEDASLNESRSFVFSPCPKAKGLSALKTRAGRRASSIARNNSSDFGAEPSFASHHSGVDCELSFANHSTAADSSIGHGDHHIFRPSTALNEFSFKAIVVGGVYQHCFDSACPLVAAPSASDKRVVDVVIQDDRSLVLSVYLPKEKCVKTIDLGSRWQWMRCSPTGYLAFRGAIIPHEKNICYFLPKHPDDWASQSTAAALADARRSSMGILGLSAMGGRMSALFGGRSNRRSSIAALHEFNPRPRQSPTARLHQEIEMDCQPLEEITRCEGLEHEDCLATAEDEEEEEGLFKMQSDDDPNLSHLDLEADALELTSLDIQEAVSAQSEHWSNSHLLSLVFEFLISDADVFGTPATPTASAATKTTARRSQRSKDASASSAAAPAVPQLQYCQGVNKAWALAAYMVIARRKSSLIAGARASFDFARYQAFATKFQSGVYLSEGVCKNVYCVYNPAAQNLEALSVMDIDDLEERDMTLAVTQEIHISLLCSAMVTLRICPNLVIVNSLFQSDFYVPTPLWGEKRPISDLHRAPRRANVVLRKNQLQSGSFQFIRTEFCSGGDVEDRLRGIGRPPDLSTVQLMLFQMCFSLYACREKLNMRHFDVKLLNFFVTTPEILHSRPTAAVVGTSIDTAVPPVTHLQIGLGQHVFNLSLSSSALALIKLADFGTSAVGSSGLGDPITIQQFTTLENTPPEFLLLGSAARQSYAADTFPLGLCFFHLLTGYAPYEELLADVHCPAYLATALRRIWLTDQSSSPYYIVHDVVKTLDVESIEGEPEDVLLDTLYRYLVLFGLNNEFSPEEAARSAYCDSPVWKALFDALDLKGVHVRLAESELGGRAKATGRNGKKAAAPSAKADCAAQYLRDAQLWSVRVGSHATMQSFRERLASLGEGADELLESLLHFDPARRCTMYDAMQHPLFASLRLSPEQAAAAARPSAPCSRDTVRYLHYYRSPLPTVGPSATASAATVDALPIL